MSEYTDTYSVRIDGGATEGGRSNLEKAREGEHTAVGVRDRIARETDIDPARLEVRRLTADELRGARLGKGLGAVTNLVIGGGILFAIIAAARACA